MGRGPHINYLYEPRTKLGLLIQGSGITQTRISQQLGISQGTLSQYVNGLKPISAIHMLRFCEYFCLGPLDIGGELQAQDIVEWVV